MDHAGGELGPFVESHGLPVPKVTHLRPVVEVGDLGNQMADKTLGRSHGGQKFLNALTSLDWDSPPQLPQAREALREKRNFAVFSPSEDQPQENRVLEAEIGGEGTVQ